MERRETSKGRHVKNGQMNACDRKEYQVKEKANRLSFFA